MSECGWSSTESGKHDKTLSFDPVFLKHVNLIYTIFNSVV